MVTRLTWIAAAVALVAAWEAGVAGLQIAVRAYATMVYAPRRRVMTVSSTATNRRLIVAAAVLPSAQPARPVTPTTIASQAFAALQRTPAPFRRAMTACRTKKRPVRVFQ